MLAMGKKYIDKTWDFRTADTKIFTHCFHPYPAMMIPQVAGRLIDTYGKNAKTLFDPFCGTGTSLVEANLRNIDAIGIDLNPLAGLIAKAKLTPIGTDKLDRYLKAFVDSVFPMRFGLGEFKKASIPSFKNIDYWFDKKVQEELAAIKNFIDGIDDENISDFFKIAFSETVRESSLTRNGEFKLYRMTEKQREAFNPDVFGAIENKLARNRKGLVEFAKARKGKPSAKVLDFNTVEGIPPDLIAPESVDIVVTSPPYGDSRTTVAYGQFTRLASQWLGFENACQVDNLLMGGKQCRRSVKFDSVFLEEAIEKISKKDEERVKDVISFYVDYKKSIDNISEIVKNGGYVCCVVGNRRVKAVTLPTDEITREFFEQNGFKHVETIIRNIPNKRMPSKNSPTNVAGESDATMSKEYIVVMRKMM